MIHALFLTVDRSKTVAVARHRVASLFAILALTLPPTSGFAAASPSDVIVVPHAELDGSLAGRARQYANGRPMRDNQRGAGIEHVSVAVCGSAVLMVGVGSYDKPGLDPDVGEDTNRGYRLQTVAVAAELTGAGLQMGPAKYVFPELNNSDDYRDGMKPMVSCLDESASLFIVEANSPKDNPRGNDESRNRAAAFVAWPNDAGMLVPMQLNSSVPVLANNNDNCADTDEGALQPRKIGDGQYQVNFIGSCNGNGDDVAWHTKFDVSCAGVTPEEPGDPDIDCTVDSDYSPIDEDSYKEQVSQGDIERYRPVTFTFPGSNRMLVLGTEGDNQPPRDGISATVVDTTTLEPISSQLIAAAANNGQPLSTMVHGAQLDANTYLVSYQTRMTRNRKGDKGPTTLMMGVLHATPEGEVSWLKAPESGLLPGLSATHHTMCATNYGDTNVGVEPAAVLLTTSFQGGSGARATIITYDAVSNAIVPRTTVVLNVNHDNALISNMYGNNPETQGKNSQYCAAAANPGYGDPASVAPEVAEFLIFPAAERRLNTVTGTFSEKLALSVALVPTVFDGPDEPATTPVDPGTDPGTDPSTDPLPSGETDTAQPDESIAENDRVGSAAASRPEAEEGGALKSGFNGGCAAVPTGLWLLLLAVAPFLRRRRR